MAQTESAAAGGFGLAVGDDEQKRPRRRWVLWLSLSSMSAVLLIAIALAVFVHGANAYARDYDGRLLAGTTIAGIDVSGMSPAEALAAIEETAREMLDRAVTVTWGDYSWTTTPADLGSTTNAADLVAQALEARAGFEWSDFARMRWLGDGLGFEADLTLNHDRRAVRRFVMEVAAEIDTDASDAALDSSTGWIEVVPEAVGFATDATASTAALYDVIASGGSELELVVDQTQPEVTTDAFRQVLLLRQNDFRVYLYQDGEITHSWPVAVGKPGYSTPTGTYVVSQKRYMPTWVNPAPNGWGKGMPLRIGPGPANPLGVRALNWSSTAIRFHGTAAVSSIGTRASHGCVRLTNRDVMELYDLVEVGTPIVSIRG